jgi:pyruvate/2-oxoglutarate dehydrogenase complex dihydrolipoamide acyltransferase (E2) component
MMGIGLASSVISSGLGMAAQADQADAQEAAIRDNQRRQQEAMKLRQQQQHEADSQAASELARRARVEESAVRASSGESGVAGNSVLALLNSGKVQLGMDTARVGTNAEARNAQNNLELQGINANSQSQINNIQQPDFIGGSLSIIKSGATAYDQYKTSSDPTYKSFRG